MQSTELDQLKLNFEDALQRWIASIECFREVLAASTHSARSEDMWRQAASEQEDAQAAVKKSREAYEEAVRQANFGF